MTKKILLDQDMPTMLLVNLPPWAQDAPHVGLGYIASYFRKHDQGIAILDLNKDLFLKHESFAMLWHVENKSFWSNKETFPLILGIFSNDIDNAINDIKAMRPNVVGFSVVDPKERLTIAFIKRLKAALPLANIVLGGPATSTQEQRKIFMDTIEEEIGAFVLGEGEVACFEVAKRFNSGESVFDIPGTLVKRDGGWVFTETSPCNLHDIPFPTYQEFNLSNYGKSLLVEWSRGCYSRCSFCKNWRLFPSYRAKDPAVVFDELSFHSKRNQISNFTVVDSIMNGSLDKLFKICSLIIENSLNISWSGQIAPRDDMDILFFNHMKRAGCHKLQIGVESGSNKVLKKMRKAYSSTTAERAVRNAKKSGIETEIFIIIGFPGESEKDFIKTYDFVKRNSMYIDTIKSINTLHLVAGTQIYEDALSEFDILSLPKENWHYLWKTKDGNSYKVRKRRAQRLLDLALRLGIEVMETNIAEGKERAVTKGGGECFDLESLKESINDIHTLKRGDYVQEKNPGFSRIIKLPLLFFVTLYTFFYIIYFWVFMKIKKRALLGGMRN